MFKKSSPLKHKEGEAIAHAPYGTEEAYHEARGGEVVKKGLTTEEQATKAITPTIGTQKDLTEFSEKFEAEKTQKIQNFRGNMFSIFSIALLKLTKYSSNNSTSYH